MSEVSKNVYFVLHLLLGFGALVYTLKSLIKREIRRYKWCFVPAGLLLFLYFVSNSLFYSPLEFFEYNELVPYNIFLGFLYFSFIILCALSQNEIYIRGSLKYSFIVFLPTVFMVVVLLILGFVDKNGLNPFGVLHPLSSVSQTILGIIFFLYMGVLFIGTFFEGFSKNKIFRVRAKTLAFFLSAAFVTYVIFIFIYNLPPEKFRFSTKEHLGIAIYSLVIFISSGEIIKRYFLPTIQYLTFKGLYYFLLFLTAFSIVFFIVEYPQEFFLHGDSLVAHILNGAIVVFFFYVIIGLWKLISWIFSKVESDALVLPHIKNLRKFLSTIYKYVDIKDLAVEFSGLFLYTYFPKRVEFWVYERKDDVFKLVYEFQEIGYTRQIEQKGSKLKLPKDVIEAISSCKFFFLFEDLIRVFVPKITKSLKPIKIMADTKSDFILTFKDGKNVYGFLLAYDISEYMDFYLEDYEVLAGIGKEVSSIIRSIEKYNIVRESKLIQRDWVIAEQIQRSLLPKEIPQLEDFKIEVYFKPAKGIGGDYYDVFRIDDNRIGVLLNDVAGKGLPAALVMTVIRSIVHASKEAMPYPKELISLLNSMIFGQVSLDRYSTEYYFVYDSNSEIITYANAGHVPMIVYSPNRDQFLELDTQGIPIGISPESVYEDKEYKTENGDIGILFTDGLNEATNLEKEQFGEERIKKIIRENRNLSPKELMDVLIKKLEDFVGEAPQHDDTTIIIWKKYPKSR